MSAQDVVEISTVDQLKAFRDAVNSGNTYAGKTVKLTADLDLSGESNWTPIGNLVAYPSQSFNGTFDGDGHSISNVTVNDNTPNHAVAGLFGSVVNGTIKNLTVKNVDLTSTHYAGGIVAYTSNGPTIENCKVIGGTIKSTPELLNGSYDNGDKAGGIMGYATAGSTINNCTVEGVTITAYRSLGGIVGFSAGTVTNNTAKNVTVTQDLTNGYKNPHPETFGEIVGEGSAKKSIDANGYDTNGNKVIKSDPVAQIGETKYETIAEAVAAVNEGETIEVIKAGDYTLPNISKNVTIEGAVDGVVFNHTTAGSVASIPNGATFKNVAFNFGNLNYHGFQHAGTINMEDCTLNGRLTSYGDMNFTNCSFNQSNSDYHMWCYSGNLTYTDCTFTNSVTGKFLNVYNESGATKYTVTVNNCKFVNNASAANKAALNVKATSGSNVLAYDVIINNITTEGAFPEANWGDALVVLNPVVQVDDRTASGVDNITVTKDGVLIYPAAVAAIGETKYPTLQAAVDAAQQMGGTVTVELIEDISGETVTIKEVANFKLTIDGKNKTVDATIVVDGLRGNGGSTTNGASVTLQNIAFVKTTATDGIQASHYPHHLTIQDCTYSGFDSDKWFFNASVDGPLYGVTIKNVTVEKARLIYANMADDAVFQNITATNDIKVGFNVKTSGTALIENCQVTTGKYAFRDYSDAYEGTFTLKDNTFVSTSTATDEGAIVIRGGAVGTAHVNVESGTYTGSIKVMNNKEGVLAISGGYFSEEFPQSYIAADLVAQGKECVPATDKEGFYTIGDPHFVAQIGETGYKSLADAVAAVPADGTETTITMIDNETVVGNAGVIIPVGKNIVLDLNGKTVTLSVTESKGSQLITNRGTLTITDSSEGQAGKLTNVADESLAVGSWPTNNYVTNVITNSGTLNIEAGNIISTANGSICYAVDNNSTSYDAILNINGGYLTSVGTVVRQFCNSTTKQNVINMTGGVVTTNGSAAIWTQLPGSSATSKKLATLNISGGEITASSYAWYDYSYGDSFEAVEYNISGGKFTGSLYSYALRDGIISGFISGGLFSPAPSSSYIKPAGYMFGPSEEVEGYYTLVPAEVDYSWTENGEVIHDYLPFNTPFKKNYLMDGETITLLQDITLTEDLTWNTEGDATFTLNLGEYKITKGNFSIKLKPGQRVNTDKTTSISTFTSAEEGYVVKSAKDENGKYYYTVEEAEVLYTAANGTEKLMLYSSSMATSDGTYKLLKDVTTTARLAPGIMASDVTLDLNGHTLTSTATDCAILLSRTGSTSKPKIFNLIDSSDEKGGILKVNPDANLAIQVSGSYNQVTIGEGVTIDGDCVALLGSNQTLTVNGTINGGNDFAIATNGSSTKNATIIVNEGAVLTSDVAAMYLPGNEGLTATINGGTITGGNTGIELRAGQLIVNGGDITSTATEYSYTPNGNGSTTKGAAIAVVQHNTKLPIDAQILGGTLTGLNQIAVVDAQENNLEDVSVRAKDDLIVTTTIPVAFKWVSNGDGTSSLAPRDAVAQIGETKYYSLADAVAAVPADGTETTITMIANEMINVTGYAVTIPATKNIILDLNGYQVVGTVEQEGTSALIRNLGTLTIKDSSDTNKDGSGTGKLMSGASPTWTWDGSDDYSGSYASNLIRNEKNLIVESGYLYNMSTGSASYAIDNYSAGNVTINGGKVDAAKASAIRMFYVNGGSITVNDGIIGHYVNDDECSYMGIQVMSGANVNVSVNGGTISGMYALYSNASGGNTSLSGGTYDGYVGFAASVPNISITDGRYGEWVGTWGDQTKFISGGVYAEEVDEEYIADGYILADNTDPETKDAYPYTVRKANYICAIGTTKYETLAEAVAAAGTAETIITLLTEAATDGVISADGVVVPSGSNITFDLNGLTYNVSGETVGSSGTKTSGFQLLKDSDITFKNGTLKATSPTAQMLIQNYSNLTIEDVNLDGTALSGWAYALSNNCGTINLTGSTSITAKSGGRAFDTCKFGSYAIPTVNINTTGAITGPIEATGGKLNIENGKFNVTWVTDSHYAAGDIQISGGVFSTEPADEYLAEGYVVVDNTDEATMNEYPFTVKSKEDAGIFDLFDDIDYARTDDVQATKVTYTRYFSPNVTDHYQAWYIPFDYTIKDEDADNFDFYKIHLISASNKQYQDDLIEDNTKVYIHIEPIPSGTVLKANRPYVIKPKAEMTHVFEAENVTLYGINNSIRLSMSTSEWDYNFYGTYTTFKEENQTAKQWIGLNTNGNYFWNKPSSSLHRYRWFIKVTANTDNGDYSKLNLVFIEDNDEATDISKKYLDEDEIEGIYTLDGVKVQTPVKGMNIIRFTNGKTKKINVKK